MIKKIINYIISFKNLILFYLKYKGKNNVCFFLLTYTGLSFLDPVIEKMLKSKRKKPFIICCSPDYIKIKSEVPVLFILPMFCKFIYSDILISNASGLVYNMVKGFKKRIHIFHSPISILKIYPSDAFDAYNYIFATGPHHNKEIPYLCKLRGKKEPVIKNVGYIKSESLYNYNKLYKRKLHGKTIIIATSWGKENIVNMVGETLIEKLLSLNYNVIFRPHPGNEIYNKNDIENIKTKYGASEKFIYGAWTGFDSMCESDLMIADWSGVSFEYASALNRPVIFINTPPKDFSDKKLSITMDTIERYARKMVGVVIEPKDISEINNVLIQVFENYNDYVKRVIDNKRLLFYNCENSSNKALEEIEKIAG